MIICSLVVFSIFVLCLIIEMPYFSHAQEELGGARSLPKKVNQVNITINDPKLKAELVTNNLKFPTTMDFLGPDDILVLEKSNGTVRRVVNGTLLAKPLLDVNVATEGERGMVGIAVTKHKDNNNHSMQPPYIFLYYTEAKIKDGGEPIANRLYRYNLVNDSLVNPKIILNLPVLPGPDHNGGKIVVGYDNNVYILVGDLFTVENGSEKITKAQNVINGDEPNGMGGILRLSENGSAVGNGILGNIYPLSMYYAYGIRNGFGLDIDPVTGNLWDTENGPNYGDEINLVKPGFNSGWKVVQGIWKLNKTNLVNTVVKQPSSLLVDFGGKGKYSAPELSWKRHYGITALKFYNSSILGKQYEKDLFVGDYHFGNIYRFDLNYNRTALSLNGILADKVANTNEEVKGKMFATGFISGITDIQVGPDGYLYVVAYGQGAIYRIMPK